MLGEGQRQYYKDMSYSALRHYVRSILSHVPGEHWAIIGVLSLAVLLLTRKKCSLYSAIALGISAFVCFFLLDTAVFARFWGSFSHGYGNGFDLAAEVDRLIHAGEARRIEMLSNIAVFVPFGFFLSEFLSSTKHFSAWRRLGYATLASFGLSLCIECLQLILRVGFFELTDLVINTAGGFIGAELALLGRKLIKIDRKETL